MVSHGLHEYYSRFRSPVGEILGLVGSAQGSFTCREIELNVLDCTDVFGFKGLQKECAEVFRDFEECIYGHKQIARVNEMRKERLRQYVAGERAKKDLWAEPPIIDGYRKTYGRTID